MTHRCSTLLLLLPLSILCRGVSAQLPATYQLAADWLVEPLEEKARVVEGDRPDTLVLGNGLIERAWILRPNAATIRYRSHMTGESLIRGVKPEAELTLDGRAISVGGLVGQPCLSYLLEEWLDRLEAGPDSFRFLGHEVTETREPMAWKRLPYSSLESPWPPPGKRLRMDYAAPPARSGVPEGTRKSSGDGAAAASLAGVRVSVYYELYDGLPLLSKWVEVHNGSGRPLELDRFKSEILALVPYEDPVERRGLNVEDPRIEREIRPLEPPRQIHFESDYAFGGGDALSANQTAHFVPDVEWSSQVNYRRRLPALVELRPPLGPDIVVEPGETFETFRTWELVFDSTDRERRGLALRRMYRAIAPWVMESPLQLHIASQDEKTLKGAIDQAADVGFEMVLVTFGSGVNLESEDPEYLGYLRSLREYASEKGIVLGAYSLLASRRIGDETDVINPETGKPGGAFFGNSPNLNSTWGREYFHKLRSFFEKTGFGQMTMDGSYPGDVCASTVHQRSFESSQWTQFQRIREFYRWCRARGIFLNVPDWYFLNGSNRSGMGYREVNWSLPRAEQIIIARQNIHDGTWEKNNSQGWMFVPLIQYHGGGPAATLEPLRENLPDLEAHLANLLGSGTPAAYRGRRLYDAPETREVWKRWVGFYKEHRAILDSDLIHLRRADGQDIDGWLKVNPRLETKGLLMLFNPLGREVRRSLRVPLYYTGLKDEARVAREGRTESAVRLDRDCSVRLEVEVPARANTWYTIR